MGHCYGFGGGWWMVRTWEEVLLGIYVRYDMNRLSRQKADESIARACDLFA